MKKVKSLLNKMSSPMRPPAGLGYLRLIKSFMSKVFSLFITTQSAEDSRQRPSGMTALLDVKAFTLVELLVVVLIIGILSAIAIPMYQGAVDKSHWSTMLPGAKALKDAEEAVRMSNGLYTSNMDNLDVRMPSGDVQYTLETINDDGAANVVRATSTKLPTVRLSNYLDENTFFGGQLHCEVKDGDERATRLCEKLLGGQYIMPVDGGYTAYLLDQAIDQATCNHAEQSWSTSKTKCYKDTVSRCTDLGLPTLEGRDLCGYTGNIVKEEGVCLVSENSAGCAWQTIQKGGVCLSYANGSANDSCARLNPDRNASVQGAVVCNGKNYCGYLSLFDGGVCVANPSAAGGSPCGYATFKNDSVCFANAAGACGSTFQDTSCCCGDYCSGKPTCSPERCAEARAQYAQYFN